MDCETVTIPLADGEEIMSGFDYSVVYLQRLRIMVKRIRNTDVEIEMLDDIFRCLSILNDLDEFGEAVGTNE